MAFQLLTDIPGINCIKPSGAFYLFPSVALMLGKNTPAGTTIDDDRAFVMYLPDTASVTVIHGSAYGLPSYLRLSLATSEETLATACRRISEECGRLT